MLRKLAVMVACGVAVILISDLPIDAQEVQYHPDVFNEVNHAVSPPLRAVRPDTFLTSNGHNVVPLRPTTPAELRQAVPDPVLQSAAGPQAAAASGVSFPGVGANGYAPPDTNGAAGATQYVQWVNVEYAVYNKTTGGLVLGPVAGNAIWASLGGACANNNSGDPIAQYDKAAQRWVLAQPVFTNPYSYCVAVSQSSDATGKYNLYQFPMPNFPDYPKLGVWPDAYYGTFNMFHGNTFVGNTVCAFDRKAMLAGTAATMQCFNSGAGSLLPSDLDGATAPPPGSPAFMLNFGTNSLNLWKFHVDFANSANSTFTGPVNIPVAAFTPACGGGACIPQLGTKQALDSLADRLMYRLAYRNFPNASPAHESLVITHSVATGTGARGSATGSGIRWYELRNPAGTPAVYQQGTYSTGSNYRWMGSIAMDKVGDIAVGYSESSSTLFPGIYYTGRLSSDPINTLQVESTIMAGTGSQTRSLNRWGDYSSMSVDPVDDCTFWYTNEYIKSNGTFNWSTQIASFKFPGCQ